MQNTHSCFGPLDKLVETVLREMEGESEQTRHSSGQLQELRVVSKQAFLES